MPALLSVRYITPWASTKQSAEWMTCGRLGRGSNMRSGSGGTKNPGLARLERILDVKDPDAGIVIGGEDEAGALEGAAACRQPAAANGEAALLPLGLMVRAKRMQQGTRDMLIARDGEELVCPKGTICGRMTRDAND